MVSSAPLEWRNFKGGWQDFQQLCAELIEANGYQVELRSLGGGDEGRDIDAFELVDLFPVQRRRVAFWAECKSRFAAVPKAVPIDEIAKCIVFAQSAGIPALVFMTNHKLSNEAKDQIARLSQMKQSPLGVSYIEQELLSVLVLEHPHIYKKYFRGQAPKKMPTAPQRIECVLRANIDPSNSDLTALTLTAFNNSLRRTEIFVQARGQNLGTLALGAFERAQLRLPAIAGANVEDGFDVIGEARVVVTLDRRYRLPPQARERRYFDPLDLASRLGARIQDKLDSYILGPPGAGKTTLAKRAVGMASCSFVYVDAGRVDAATRFNDLLSGPLQGSAAVDADADDAIPTSVLVDAEHRASPANLRQDHVLILDNLHALTEADLPALQSLLVQRPGQALILVARPAEFECDAVERLFFSNHDDREAYYRLDQAVLARALAEAIEQLAADEPTRRFLGQFRRSGNFQSFLLLIDALEARGFLEREGETGRLHLTGQEPSLAIGDYHEILRAIIEAAQFRGDGASAHEVLGLASLWGKDFPVDLIIFALGAEGERCVNELINVGLFVDSEAADMETAFEHDLTQEVTARALPRYRAREHHRTILSFLEALGEGHSLNSTTRRAYHLEHAGRGDDAAAVLYRFLSEARGRLERRQALATALHTLSLMDAASTSPSDSAPEDVIGDLLTWIIEFGHRCHGPDWGRDFLRRFEFMAHASGSPSLLGRSAYFWARFKMDQQKASEALIHAECALEFLEQSDADPYLLQATNRLGNIQKNLSQFVSSLKTHVKAARQARAAANSLEMARTLREFGATLLEAGRATRTVLWWSTSLRHAQASGDLEEIVLQKANLTYARALTHDRSESVRIAFEQCDALAERFEMFSQQAKNLVNWANWLFHEAGQPTAGYAKIGEALRLAEILDYEYAKVIAQFSYVSFARCEPGVRRRDYEDALAAFINGTLLGCDRLETMADARFVSLVKFFVTYLPDKLDPAVLATRNVQLAPFIDALRARDLAAIERGNAYYRPSGLWAVYY